MRSRELNQWSDLQKVVQRELTNIGHGKTVVVRNFERISFDESCNEVDRLEIAKTTGTDRDSESPFWDAPGHDHEHDIHPCGKKPDEIIYAFTVDFSTQPYTVHHGDSPGHMDITDSLSEHSAVLVYDAAGLDRQSENEYWFNTDPRKALLIVLTSRS